MAFEMGANAVASILGGAGNRSANYAGAQRHSWVREQPGSTTPEQQDTSVSGQEGNEELAPDVPASLVAEKPAVPESHKASKSTSSAIDTTVILTESDREWLVKEKLERKISRDGRPSSMSAIIVEAVRKAVSEIEGGTPVDQVALPIDEPGCRMSVLMDVELWADLYRMFDRLRRSGVPSGCLSMSAVARGGMALLRRSDG